jgi:hypothetical protein
VRRIAFILCLLGAVAGTVAAGAGADDKRSYQAELFNAFGLVEGAELRMGGVPAGSITDLDITEQKTALVSFETDLSTEGYGSKAQDCHPSFSVPELCWRQNEFNRHLPRVRWLAAHLWRNDADSDRWSLTSWKLGRLIGRGERTGPPTTRSAPEVH